jgi:hypothetical protein
MNDPVRMRRRDSFVLYVHDRDWRTFRDDFIEVHARCVGCLREDVPGFTLPLGPGWSFAEEPAEAAGALSFGQHRALLAADGLFAAYEHDANFPDGRFAWIRRKYREAGLDLARPYLDRRPL